MAPWWFHDMRVSKYVHYLMKFKIFGHSCTQLTFLAKCWLQRPILEQNWVANCLRRAAAHNKIMRLLSFIYILQIPLIKIASEVITSIQESKYWFSKPNIEIRSLKPSLWHSSRMCRLHVQLRKNQGLTPRPAGNPPRGEGGVPRPAPHCGEGGVPCPAP